MPPEEFQMLLLKMDEGFGKVYGKIDDLKEKFDEHKTVCATRFSTLEQSNAVRTAVNCEHEKTEKVKRDWGRYIIRGTLGLVALKAIADIIAGVLKG